MHPTGESVKTTCPYCGVGCGITARLDDDGVVTIKGDNSHPANLGRLCSKGSALGDTVQVKGRLLYPEVLGQQVSWELALSTVAQRFAAAREKYGPESVAFYVSGQLLTEDYYVANKLMKGFIGSANIDTNSRLCMSSTVAGYKRAFGEDVVPCSYSDLESSDMIVLTGSNTAWCHPVLYQRIKAAKRRNPDLFVVVIDPRKTSTMEVGDLHLPLRPGSDAVLFNGLLSFLWQQGKQNKSYSEEYCNNVDDALKAALDGTGEISQVADKCKLSTSDVEKFYRKFADTEKVISVFSQGINQSSSGVDKVNSIINCHLLTGRIGKAGMGPFSFTGQPNAMGGREVGGLANQLAAHMELSNPRHRELLSRFWDAETIPESEGLKAIDLFDAVEQGKIKALWIMATNPAVSMPESDRVRQAISDCEFVVVSDCTRNTDTADLAHVKLPAMGWGEKDGTVTNSDRTISRQRQFLPTAGLARPDWWIISEVGRLMGWEKQFNYTSAAEIFREHAQLSTFENEGERLFNLGALSALSEIEYNQLQPVQWPVTRQAAKGTRRLFNDRRFPTADGKANFIPVRPRLPVSQPNQSQPLVLNTGRVRDHWHTMTRTGLSSRLSAHTFEPIVEIHPQDATQKNLQDGQLAKLTSLTGKAVGRVKITDSQQRGSLFMPMHWNSQFSACGKPTALVPSIADPVSGQPESKHATVDISHFEANWHGFILTRRDKLDLQYASYWTRARGPNLWRFEIAGSEQPENWADRARSLLCCTAKDINWVEYFDSAKNHYRAARLVEGRLESCVFIGPDENLPVRDWLTTLFDQPKLSNSERASLLSGRPPADQEDFGKTVCSCFNVGEKTIRKAIVEHGLKTPEELGELLKAGTNCGSCIPELQAYF